MSNDTNESFWRNLVGDRKMFLLLGVGAILLLWNLLIALGLNTRPNAWLCYLDMHYWSPYFSTFLWIAAIGVAADFIDVGENYRLTVRMIVVAGIVFAGLFAWRSSFAMTNPLQGGNPLWIDAFVIIAICCAIRSLFLVYNYRYSEEESVDLEEAIWFWVLSGFLWTVLIVVGIMHTISVKVPIQDTDGGFTTQSLFDSCRNGFWILYQFGLGSVALKAFGLLIFLSAVAFVCVAGKWVLVFLSKMKNV